MSDIYRVHYPGTDREIQLGDTVTVARHLVQEGHAVGEVAEIMHRRGPSGDLSSSFGIRRTFRAGMLHVTAQDLTYRPTQPVTVEIPGELADALADVALGGLSTQREQVAASAVLDQLAGLIFLQVEG